MPSRPVHRIARDTPRRYYSGQMPFCEYLARYSPGVMPLCFLKTFVKWLCDRYARICAISLKLYSDYISMFSAASMRLSVIYCDIAVPVSRLNSSDRYVGFKCTRCARIATVIFSCRW